ncbi:MAG TPA: PadR family transcriptional regulator [Gemmatimonadaceae bacterium]
MPVPSAEFRQGAIELLILKTLSWHPMHGYAIARWIQQTTDDVLSLEEGSLYPALHRMEDKGWIEAEWGTSENNRRAKFYALTGRGRKQLQSESASWMRFSDAVGKVLRATRQPA